MNKIDILKNKRFSFKTDDVVVWKMRGINNNYRVGKISGFTNAVNGEPCAYFGETRRSIKLSRLRFATINEIEHLGYNTHCIL